MKKLCLIVWSLLALVSESSGEIVVPFPGIEKLIERSDLAMVVQIENHEFGLEIDTWGRYRSRVLFVLKGDAPEKGSSLVLRLCGAITDSPHSFSSDTVYLVFLNKDSTGSGEYRAPAIIGAVLRVSPLTREYQLKGTLREKIEQVIRDGRDFCKETHYTEQKVFRAVLGDTPPLPAPGSATPAPKR